MLNIPDDTTELAMRVRTYLAAVAAEARPITYQALAKVLALTPPHTIHQLSLALEHLMEEDAVSGNPLIAALVVSKFRGGIPAPGFFDFASEVGRFDGTCSGQDAIAFHTAEFDAAIAFWGKIPSE